MVEKSGIQKLGRAPPGVAKMHNAREQKEEYVNEISPSRVAKSQVGLLVSESKSAVWLLQVGPE